MYSIRLVRFQSGERFPFLVDDKGAPQFGPTLYALTIPRAKGRASNTIENILRSIQVLLLYLAREQIDLGGRVERGVLLTLPEIDALVLACRQPLEVLTRPLTSRPSTNLRSLDDHRARLSPAPMQVVSQELLSVRLSYIRAYIVWVVRLRAQRPGTPIAFRRRLESEAELFAALIKERVPSVGVSDGKDPVEGYDADVETALLEAVLPNSPNNPWRGQDVRERNQLLVLWLHSLGLRRGELLGVRISDINFRVGEVTIHRRPDNPEDPRKMPPQVKTLARKLAIRAELLDLTREYILVWRAQIPGAKKHDYLFVSTENGSPLSLSSATKVFEKLRAKVPGLPRNLSAHKVRHRWNDRFSELMDKNKVDPEREKKIRSAQMGWKESSNMAAVYTRRHVRKQAERASLSLQGDILTREEE